MLIAGAGLAGLAAARELTIRGARVTIWDARDRVGGRVWTIREGFAARQHAEGGADLIESHQHPVIDLARALRLPLVPVLKHGFGFFGAARPGGQPRIQTGTRRFGQMFAPFADAVRQYRLLEGRWDGPIARALGRLSVADYLIKTGASPAAVERLRGLRGFFLADPEDLSMLALADFLATDGFGGDGRTYRLKGGNDRLATRMAESLDSPVRLHTVLRQVQHHDAGVTVTIEDQVGRHTLQGDALIVALPATAAREVVFTPGMPASQWQAISTLAYGGATRVLLQFASRFWRKTGRPLAFGSDQVTGAVWDGNEQQAGPAGILSLLSGGRASHEMVALLNAEQADGVVRRLSWLGRPSRCLASHVVRWNDDPWVRGGYAAFDPQFEPSGRDLLGRAVGHIHFAGEHTSLRFQGYMSGAIESGLRTAAEVLAAR